MRRLYFDIDGTLLALDTGGPKPALMGGSLERSIKEAQIDEIVCVSNFVDVIRAVWMRQPDFDGLGAVYSLCGGVFSDQGWFRRVTQFVSDPQLRAAEIDLMSDWWYMDDEAENYFLKIERREIFDEQLGRRVLRPSPSGDGRDVIEWLRSIPGGA